MISYLLIIRIGNNKVQVNHEDAPRYIRRGSLAKLFTYGLCNTLYFFFLLYFFIFLLLKRSDESPHSPAH